MPTINGQLINAQAQQPLPNLQVAASYRVRSTNKEVLAQSAASDKAGGFQLEFPSTLFANLDPNDAIDVIFQVSQDKQVFPSTGNIAALANQDTEVLYRSRRAGCAARSPLGQAGRRCLAVFDRDIAARPLGASDECKAVTGSPTRRAVPPRGGKRRSVSSARRSRVEVARSKRCSTRRRRGDRLTLSASSPCARAGGRSEPCRLAHAAGSEGVGWPI
jgi:hypothetical protein